jgi:SAM-dependent methyltransferase
MLTKLIVPEELHRNAPAIAAAGYEHTGETLVKLVLRRVGLPDLADTDVLDVGCGVRLAMTLINRKIAIKSYTGVDVEPKLISFLKQNVEEVDNRFRFILWDVYNREYNRGGKNLAEVLRLPVAEEFDLIWLFSVFTHQLPNDAAVLLRILRQHIRSTGKLMFSFFATCETDRFVDKSTDGSSIAGFYHPEYMRSLVEAADWRVRGIYDKDADNYIQSYFVCAPP